MSLFQGVFVPLCSLAALWYFLRILRGNLPRRQGLIWLFIWAAAAIMIAWPRTASRAATLLGIGRGADLVFYCAILGGILVTAYFYNRYRRLENAVTELLRRQAIDRAERGDNHSERSDEERT